jgi:hypothetical protein
MEKALRTVTKLDFDWAALEAFRNEFLPTIRDEQVREFVADFLAKKIDRHPLRAFSPAEARAFVKMRPDYLDEPITRLF